MITITKAKTSGIIWKNIICQFGILYALVIDNRRSFDNEKYYKMCLELGIKCYFSSLVHPQANSQAEAANKVIKYFLKTKLGSYKGAWADELSNVL